MTPTERDQLLAIGARIFRPGEIAAQLRLQTHRVRRFLKSIPVVGAGISDPSAAVPPAENPVTREQTGLEWFDSTCTNQLNRLNGAVAASAFWREVRQWTGREPKPLLIGWSRSLESRACDAIRDVDEALNEWSRKVENECRGTMPHVAGAVTGTTMALLIVLAAVPGPMTALTLPLATKAMLAGLSHLGMSGAVGAVLGKPAGRLVAAVRERLLSSPEFDHFCQAAEGCRRLIEEHGRRSADQLIEQAEQLVLPADDPLNRALVTISREAGKDA